LRWTYLGWSKTVEEASFRLTELANNEWEAKVRKTKSGRCLIYGRKKCEGRIFRVGKYTVAVRLPKTLVQDSAFPLKVGDKVHVKVDGNKIIVVSLAS